MPTPAELASTPRPRVDFEMLALKVSPGIVADTSAYDRVARDVTAIKSTHPELADISYLPGNDGRQILLNVDKTTYVEMASERYSAWNCLNEAYGLVQVEYLDFGSFNAFVTLKGIYRLQGVAAQYAQLPGVTMASPANAGIDGSTICLTGDGATWHYVFDRGSGDCPLGCIEHKYRHLTTDAAGTIDDLGDLSPELIPIYAAAAACH